MKFGIIGIGNMSQAILGGVLRKGLLQAEDIMVSRRNTIELDWIQKSYGVFATTNNLEVVHRSDIILLGVKPQFFATVLAEIKDMLRPDQLVISMAPGKSLQWIENQIGKPMKLVRCMPNTPALVGEGCTGLCMNEQVTKEEQRWVGELFASVGKASFVREDLMDAVVGVSGSAPAYIFMLIEAMADAGVAAGMPRKQAYEFVAQAVLGSAKMVLETGKHPGELKDMVCSPAGTTIEAVKKLEEKGFRSAIMEAIDACIQKAKSI